VHGVERKEPALKGQGFDHGLGGGDFIALLIDLQMAQDQRLVDRKGA